MGIELARHLIESQTVPRADVEAALLRHARDLEPFLCALTEGRPEYAERIERELLRLTGPARSAPPLPQFLQRLPLGLVVRSLAFPVGVTSSTGEIDVLGADPLDALVGTEFTFHLGRPVRVLRGTLAHQIAALAPFTDEWKHPHTKRQNLEFLNQPADSRLGHDSLPPIPLVQKPPLAAPGNPGTLRGVAPQFLDPEGSASEKTAGLTQSLQWQRSERLVQELGKAENADAVTLGIALVMSSFCEEVLVFAVRGERLCSRVRLNQQGEPERFVDLELPRGSVHCLRRALSEGQLLLAPSPEDQLLLVGYYPEFLVTRVDVQRRAALLFVSGGFADSFRTSQMADRVGRAASEALTRLVRERKR